MIGFKEETVLNDIENIMESTKKQFDEEENIY